MASDNHCILSDKNEFLDAAILTLGHGHRTIRIFSEAYDKLIFENNEFIRALKKLCSENDRVEVRILTSSNILSLKSHPKLLELAQRMPSKIIIKEAVDVEKECKGQFIVGGRRAVLHQPNIDSTHAYTDSDYPVRAAQLGELFDRLWQQAEPCSGFRALSL